VTPSIKKTTDPSPSLSTLLEGWQFRIDEISPNYFRVEGKSNWGHSISRTCQEIDLKATLEACVHDARDIQKQIQEK
jgi:hypothetical protein